MALPLLSYTPKSQNVRVAGYVVPGDEEPYVFDTENLPKGSDIDEFIWAAYRQIYSEHQILKSNRQTFLESQLKDERITMRQFIRGLLLSDPFRRRNFETNSNYRFAELCVQRVLGRDVHSEREKIAWSIVIANKGVEGFVDELLNSDEYLDNFGDTIVPFQRRRNLPQRAMGETPFNLKTPRYGAYHRNQLGFPRLFGRMLCVASVLKRSNPPRAIPSGSSAWRGLCLLAQPSAPRPSLQNLNYLAAVPRR